MKSIVLKKIGSAPELDIREPRNPDAGEVLIKVQAAALNRRDFWITRGMYPDVQLPVVLGSDGAGSVVQVGDGVSEEWLQKHVVVNPGGKWGSDERYQSNAFEILGMPEDGTFSEQLIVPVESIHLRPDHMDAVHAAALPLAGVTAYRALFSQANLQENERVLVTGAGGGVATFLIQFATAAGGQVFVTSSSEEKIESAVKLGARQGFNYRDDSWSKQLINSVGSMDVIIDSAGGDGYNDLVRIASPGGRIVNYGATKGPAPGLDLFKLFWKQLRLMGSTMGSPSDFAEMLTFVGKHEIQPVIDQIVPMSEFQQLFDRMGESSQFGKLVMTMD